jgi:hypothetical protein
MLVDESVDGGKHFQEHTDSRPRIEIIIHRFGETFLKVCSDLPELIDRCGVGGLDGRAELLQCDTPREWISLPVTLSMRLRKGRFDRLVYRPFFLAAQSPHR